jgi:hypothetical protein
MLCILPSAVAVVLLLVGGGVQGHFLAVAALTSPFVALYMMGHRIEMLQPFRGLDSSLARDALDLLFIAITSLLMGIAILVLQSSTTLAGEDLMAESFHLLNPPPSLSIGLVHAVAVGSFSYLFGRIYFRTVRVHEDQDEVFTNDGAIQVALHAGTTLTADADIALLSERLFDSILEESREGCLRKNERPVSFFLLMSREFFPPRGSTLQSKHTLAHAGARLFQHSFKETERANALPPDFSTPGRFESLEVFLRERRDLLKLISFHYNRGWHDFVEELRKLDANEFPLDNYERLLKNLLHFSNIATPHIEDPDANIEHAPAVLYAFSRLYGPADDGTWSPPMAALVRGMLGLFESDLYAIANVLHWGTPSQKESLIKLFKSMVSSNDGLPSSHPAVNSLLDAIRASALASITRDVPSILGGEGEEETTLNAAKEEYVRDVNR